MNMDVIFLMYAQSRPRLIFTHNGDRRIHTPWKKGQASSNCISASEYALICWNVNATIYCIMAFGIRKAVQSNRSGSQAMNRNEQAGTLLRNITITKLSAQQTEHSIGMREIYQMIEMIQTIETIVSMRCAPQKASGSALISIYLDAWTFQNAGFIRFKGLPYIPHWNRQHGNNQKFVMNSFSGLFTH